MAWRLHFGLRCGKEWITCFGFDAFVSYFGFCFLSSFRMEIESHTWNKISSPSSSWLSSSISSDFSIHTILTVTNKLQLYQLSTSDCSSEWQKTSIFEWIWSDWDVRVAILELCVHAQQQHQGKFTCKHKNQNKKLVIIDWTKWTTTIRQNEK